MRRSVDRIVDEAIELAAATPITPGVRDLVLTPSHLALTIHEIVAHATELDRVVGYEANYAGTSFVKVSDIGKLQVRIEAVQHHRRQGAARRPRDGRLRRRRREDDAVPDRARRHPRRPLDAIARPRTTSARKRAAAARRRRRGATTRSCGCRTCTSSRARPGSPTPEQIIADTKDGVLIEGSGQLLDRSAALQRPVRRRRVLGDQERQEDARGDQRHLQRHHDGLLGQPRRDLRAGVTGSSSASAATRRASRRRARASRTARRGCGSARSWSVRRFNESTIARRLVPVAWRKPDADRPVRNMTMDISS